ncbi:hypothetical protein R6Q59_022785 [Mikania micrantha]
MNNYKTIWYLRKKNKTKTALITATAPQAIIFLSIHVHHHQPPQAINSPRRAPPQPTTLIRSQPASVCATVALLKLRSPRGATLHSNNEVKPNGILKVLSEGNMSNGLRFMIWRFKWKLKGDQGSRWKKKYEKSDMNDMKYNYK